MEQTSFGGTAYRGRRGRQHARRGLDRGRHRRGSAAPRRLIAGTAALLGVLALGGTVPVTGSPLLGPAEAATTTLRFAATDDSYVMAAHPGTASGASARLVAGSLPRDRKVTYLKFVVRGVPAGAGQLRATLLLTRDAHHLPPTVTVSAVAGTKWSENTMTMRNAPAPGRPIGSASTTRATVTVAVPVTSVVHGNGVYSFAVTSPSTATVARFQSSEAGAAGPRLELRYLPPVKPAPAPAPAGCQVSALLVPSCGAWWGVAPGAWTSQPRDAALADFEREIGRRVDIMHVYHRDAQLFPTTAEIAVARQAGRHRLLLVNWKPETGRTWAQVAAGDPTVDGQIDALAAHIRATFPERFFLTIHHEPENDVRPAAGSGYTAGDYRAMFRHVVLRLRAAGVTNAVTVMDYIGDANWGAAAWFDQLYPGDEVVDWIGYDQYSRSQPGYHHGDFAEMADRRAPAYPQWPGFYSWATRSHPDKPLMMAEWGVFDWSGDPASKPSFFAGVGQQISRFPRLKALVYFDSPQVPGLGSTAVDSTPAALDAYRRLGRLGYFNQPVPAA